jgi:hypothetical protein
MDMSNEVFTPWPRAQREVGRLAYEAPPPPPVLRMTTDLLAPEAAAQVTDWFTGRASAPAADVRASYGALERETARLYEIIRRDLGVRIRHVRDDPYASAAELCADLRQNRSMLLRTIACDAPHPLLADRVVDRLRVVHDVFGHAALGLGFDLQSEYATWLQCRTLFSAQARGAAFCELVGAVTAYVTTGEKPALRADLPPAELLAACDRGDAVLLAA